MPVETREKENRKITRMSQTHVGRSYACVAFVTYCACIALVVSMARSVFPILVFIAGLGAAVIGVKALEKYRKRFVDPTHQLMLGVFLMFLGVTMENGVPWPVHAAVKGIGVAFCFMAGIKMEKALCKAERFLLGEEGELQASGWLFSIAGVVGVVLGTVGTVWEEWRIAVPLLCCAALLLAFEFPLSTRWIKKLDRWFELSAEGRETPERRRQLEVRLIPRTHQPFLLHFLESTLRILYRQKAQGLENVHPDDENPIVYLCNHGDLYGPIAAWLTIPTEKRPWSIAYISTTVETAEAYLYKYDWSVKTWMPDWLRHFMAHSIACFAVWATHNLLEAVPVWRDSPRQLINTFRLTVDAMQCGDNLLIFPENPNAAGEDHGYEKEGLGELFSGFAMLAQIYYNKTGKRCRFLPMFAHQKSRTVRFGTEIVYDPDNDPTDERTRISDEAARQMLAMYQELEAGR